MSDISDRLYALRREMQAAGIDVYYIPTDDYHGSEYVGEYFKSREYISGFTGSAGSVVITQSYAGLWTDSRYYIQAEQQLSGTEYVLNRSGEKGVISPVDHIIKTGGRVGFDGKCVNGETAEKIAAAIGRENIISVDLIGKIWNDRPSMPRGKVFSLDIKYSGEDTESKISRLRKILAEKKADYFLTSAPDEICWLLNVRGNDIAYNPVILSYFAVTPDNIIWFVDENKISGCQIPEAVKIAPYEDFYVFLHNIPAGSAVLLDKKNLNYEAVSALNESVKIINEQSPLTLMKAVKNSIEMNNERQAHIKDGIAVTKFICEIKTNTEKYTELSAAELLISLRKQQQGYIEESFEPIIAYGEHGAVVHYSADENSSCPLGRSGFLLCDTGGHYYEGTTDITRTVCLGEPTQAMKAHYTAVLRGHLALASAVFKKGCHGYNLDILARKPLWEAGLDFGHGTGHGVGYLLNVHEAPNGFRMRYTEGHDCVLEEGMITSDEPGLYIEGQYGIRTESLLLCRNAETTSFGEFMRFENLTLVPFDPDAVEPSLMSEKEKAWYNEYQQRVYDIISPYLSDSERKWLKNETRTI